MLDWLYKYFGHSLLPQKNMQNLFVIYTQSPVAGLVFTSTVT
jgi:hypothetical protein